MGESAHGLMGSDFCFDWWDAVTEDAWSDFWGSEEQLNRLLYAHDQMVDLHNRITVLYERFANEYDSINRQIQERIDTEWEKDEY